MAKTIVVPLDGSQLAERALPWATLLARQSEASLTLVRIVPWPELPIGDIGGYVSPETYEDVLSAEDSAAQTYLTRIQSELSPSELSTSTVLRTGLAAESILDIVDELGATAVVMASHGRGGVARLVLGSVAERLIHNSTVPVVLVKATDPVRVPALQRILVALDGSSFAELGLEHAREIAGAETTLVLLRVVEPVLEAVGADPSVFLVDEATTSGAQSEAAAYLEKEVATLKAHGVAAESQVSRGRPSTEILRVAKESSADAIVMATHGFTGPTRLLMGSVADEVARHADQTLFLLSVRMAAARLAGDRAVRDLMTRDVEVIRDDEPVVVALRKLLRRRISGAPVVSQNGELQGVISEQDLLTWHRELTEELARDDSRLNSAEYLNVIQSTTVGKLVSRPAISIEENAEISAATRLLTERQIQRLPVTQDGRLVGIISRADILKGMAAHWEAVAEPVVG